MLKHARYGHYESSIVPARRRWLYLLILHARLYPDLQSHRLASILDIVALLTFLCLELLKHAWSNLLGHHLHFAIALPLALGWLDHIPVSCYLRNSVQQNNTTPEIAIYH